MTCAPALASSAASGLPEPVTEEPDACAASSAGVNVMPVPGVETVAPSA